MKFPEYLRHLITSRGLNVSDTARIVRVERSTLSRAVNGTRLPKWSIISQLSDCLQLTPEEARKLRALYNEAAMGENAYRIRERVKNLILSLCSPTGFSGNPSPSDGKSAAVSFGSTRDTFPSNGFTIGAANVQTAISAAIHEEEQIGGNNILMLMPPDNKVLLDWLTNECRAVGGIMIEHLVYYVVTGDDDGTDVLNGLDILEFALNMMLADGGNYHPFFLYSDSVNTADALPNLIVTSKRLLRISRDYTRAEVSSNHEAIQYYRFHIQQLKAFCRPFIKFQFDPMEMMQDYSKVNTGVACQTIMNHPCTGQYITEEIIQTSLLENLPDRDVICKMAIQYFSGMAASFSKNTSFFTKSGIRDFLKTGVINDVPREIYHPLSMKYRREIIEHLIDDIRSGRASAWLIDETILSIPPNLTIGTSEYPVGVFFSNQIAELNIPYFSIIVTERSIAQALYDFMMYLPTSNFVHDQQETLAVLQQCLNETFKGE